MNRSQIVLAAIGGTVVVCALALGYFIWDAASAKVENAETLDDGLSAARRLVGAFPIKPETSALKIYEDNAVAYDEWRQEAAKLAARGDLVFEQTTPAAFKTALVADARRFADRAGCFEGKVVRPDFHFGFRDYVTGGAMPPEKDLKRLQREWNDVLFVLKTIANSGSNEVGIVDVRLGAAKAQTEAESDEAKTKSKKKSKSKKAKAKVEADEGDEGAKNAALPDTRFTVDFMARPSGLVRAVNAFATCERFVVVENFTFTREKDEIAERLGSDANKPNESPRAGSRRRNRQVAQQAAVQEDVQGGIVTDPSSAPLLKVTMAISVHDFGSLEGETK